MAGDGGPRVGRPRKFKKPVPLRTSVESEVMTRLDQFCRLNNLSRADVTNAALVSYLPPAKTEKELLDILSNNS